ncbi:ABC transporter permease [Parachlamydia sp.]|uniref:ABC transporter permease n=1 Tax=Parachlamydia sp. TaxID=2052048 RepID=UPI003D0C92DF
MFELSVALKYLLPRWRQLSVSIISLISILVISLVVWLIVVFLSVTHGLEKIWTQKLVALTAPIRITPTENYYRSYYYQIDGISAESDFTSKTIGEKRLAAVSDPYNPDEDEEIPALWLAADRLEDGTLKDPVKKAFAILEEMKDVPGLRVKDYEMTAGSLNLRLILNPSQLPSYTTRAAETDHIQSFMSQSTWLGSFDAEQVNLLQALLPVDSKDLTNVLAASDFALDNSQEEHAEDILMADAKTIHKRIQAFFESVNIRQLKTQAGGWVIPTSLFPAKAEFAVFVEKNQEKPKFVWIVSEPKREISSLASRPGKVVPATLRVESNQGRVRFFLKFPEDQSETLLSAKVPVLLEENIAFPAKLVTASLENAHKVSDVRFQIEFKLQNVLWKGEVPFQNLAINEADFSTVYTQLPKDLPLWLFAVTEDKKQTLVLPIDEKRGQGILLPKTFKEAGVLIGDTGYLAYLSPTVSSVQEQRAPVFVAGFYDPGIIPIGGKFVLINQEMTSLIRSSQNQTEVLSSNGLNVNFDRLQEAPKVKESIEKAFSQAGISPYWKVETFREYEFTRDLIQQLGTERTLWSLIATVIIIVACSNIISMLIILVNDKKMEIGILRSMGASSLSIAMIFGFCGVVMGLAGSLIGVTIAWITLSNIQVLVDLISQVQGYQAFNPAFFGRSLPNEMSLEALFFVFVTTIVISLLAGIVPAVKASMLRPSAILRSE